MKIFVTVLLMVFSIGLSAHHVVIYGYVKGGKVFSESSFQNGNPVKGGSVKVLSSDGNLLLEGNTDEDGEFAFKIPSAVKEMNSGLEVVLYAGEGHKGTWSLSFEDITGGFNDSLNSSGGKGDSLGNSPELRESIAGKAVMGLAAIAIIFAVLYYIKRKLKI